MSGSRRETRERESESEDCCVVCWKEVEIYSVGVCDHPVCYDCSTRMRVLCGQNECPICRGQMPKVIFTRKKEPFSALFPHFEQTTLQDRKHGLIFTTSEAQKAYYKLLEYRCNICSKDANHSRKYVYFTFQQLKDHMRREHQLAYCDICVENLKIFAFERRCYTRQELGYHRRKGDPDNTSHRGHPLCEFCDTRFMDSDELFRHLRRNHLFCHFCDADGKHQYYDSMEDLKKHFAEDHHLCEEGECKNMPLIAVFRTEIDLKAHIATDHTRHLSKSATRQARTLELEFTLAPRPRPGGGDRFKRPITSRIDNRADEEGAVGYNIEPGGPGGGIHQVNALNSQNFPALGNTSTVTVQSRPSATVNFTSKVNPFSGEDFPSLGGSRSSAVTITTNSSASRRKAPEVTITRTIRGGNGSEQNLKKNAENFPSLGKPSSGTSTVRLSVNNGQISAPKVSIHVNHHNANGGGGGYTSTHITTTPSTPSQSISSSSMKPSSAPSMMSSASSGAGDFNIHQKPAEAFPALTKSQMPSSSSSHHAQSQSSQPKWVQAKPKRAEPKAAKVAPAPLLPPTGLSDFPALARTDSKKCVSSNNGNTGKKSNSVTVPVSGATTNNSAKASEEKSGKNKKAKKKNNNNNNNGSGNINNNINNVNSVAEPAPNSWNENEVRNVQKKVSELRIGSLSSQNETQQTPQSAPPGFPAKPPPGLTNSAANFPALGSTSPSDLTFTNSSGRSYPIKPSMLDDYYQPANFSARNQNLIKRLTEVTDNDAVREFKTYSGLFRSGDLPPRRYYEHCRAILRGHFEDIFPELLAILPDIRKQQDLYGEYDGGNKSKLVVCENCRQVVFKRELAEHYNSHKLQSHFPSLGPIAGRGTDSSGAWRK